MPSHPGVASGVVPNSTPSSIFDTLTIPIAHNKAGLVWVISQVAVLTDPPKPFKVQLFLNSFPLTTPVTVLSGSAASGDPPISIGDHDTLNVVLTSVYQDSKVTVAYYYDEERGHF